MTEENNWNLGLSAQPEGPASVLKCVRDVDAGNRIEHISLPLGIKLPKLDF